MPLAQLLASFQSLPLLPTSKLGLSGADSQVGGLMHISGPPGSLQWTLLWGWEFLSPAQPLQVFTARGFEAFFSHTGTLGCSSCLAPQLLLPTYLHMNVGPPGLPAAALPWSSLPQVPILVPPASLDECFFFKLLVIRLPYSSIFWKFWLFFVSKLIVDLLLFVRGSRVYLPTPSSWLVIDLFFVPIIFSFPEGHADGIIQCVIIRTFVFIISSYGSLLPFPFLFS